jgi:hypothetical protein
MKFSEVARRLTGISCPIFGISWDPGEAKVASARRVLVFLEDRRVLFIPFEAEQPDHCVESILEVRRFLTTELGHLDDKDQDVAPHLRAMRASCRAFLDRTATIDEGHRRFRRPLYGAQEWVFNQALGELRGEFGIHVAQLSAKFGIDIEDQLAVILPAEVNEDEGDLEGQHRPRFGRS